MFFFFFVFASVPDCLNRRSVGVVDCSVCLFHDLLLEERFAKRLQRATGPKHSVDEYRGDVDENIRSLMYLAIREVRGH